MTDAPLGIVALGGALPLSLAQNLAEQGRGFHCICVEGVTAPSLASYPHTIVPFLKLGGLIEALKRCGAREIVFAGQFFRPRLSQMRMDPFTLRHLPLLMLSKTRGDDALMRRVTAAFEKEGFLVLSLKDVAPSLVAGEGPLGLHTLDEKARGDIATGFAALKQIGALDIGQALVIDKKRIIAVEAAEGTDRMLQRVADLRGTNHYPAPKRSGFMIKATKPQQQLRNDMPVIGKTTVENAIAAGLEAIVIESGHVVTADLPDMIKLANEAKLAIVGASVP